MTESVVSHWILLNKTEKNSSREDAVHHHYRPRYLFSQSVYATDLTFFVNVCCVTIQTFLLGSVCDMLLGRVPLAPTSTLTLGKEAGVRQE